MSTFEMCRKAISSKKAKGTLDTEITLKNLDILLFNNRLTEDEYKILVELVMADEG